MLQIIITVPEQPNDSFYKGVPYVTLKDKVFEASSTLRHAAERVAALLEQTEDQDTPSPILLEYTDGGGGQTIVLHISRCS